MLEQALVELIAGHPLRQFQPVIESTISSVYAKSHFLEGLAISLSLPIVVFLDRLTSLLHTIRLKQFHRIVL